MVRRGLEERKPLEAWPLSEMRRFSPLFEEDVFDRLSLAGSIRRKEGIGGTSKRSIEAEIRKIKKNWK
ncbi:MAG TPA: hypothetical protein VI382_06520, partial [Candidatus Manganitrophaceae bacterium]|nr:hypothetical protein [Candidatus Manganitrophaceae bacterium]